MNAWRTIVLQPARLAGICQQAVELADTYIDSFNTIAAADDLADGSQPVASDDDEAEVETEQDVLFADLEDNFEEVKLWADKGLTAQAFPVDQYPPYEEILHVMATCLTWCLWIQQHLMEPTMKEQA